MKHAVVWLCRYATGLVIACRVGGLPLGQAAEQKPQPGLSLTFRSLSESAETELTAVPGIALYVESGRPPAPFVSSGTFSATWEGFLTADLRSDFFFQAELNGRFKLEINGAVALDAAATNGSSALSKAIQLNKGANALKATFVVHDAGDAFVRLGWTEKGAFVSPIPTSRLTHTRAPQMEKAEQLRLGRELFLEHRCVKCHTDKLAEPGVPELKMDAPSFEGIGARRNTGWMARWIFDPKFMRPTARMPRLLRSANAREEAEAIAAYLASLKSGAEISLPNAQAPVARPATAEREPADQPGPQHKPLFEKLHCVACHDAPGTNEKSAEKISLQHVSEKFAPGKLTEFLRAPDAHYAWTRMPDFKLSPAEANELAEFLLASTDKPKGEMQAAAGVLLERGKRLVQSSGCLNCHSLKLENQFSAPVLASLSAPKWQQGCMAVQPKPDSKTPDFGFTSLEREALQAFGAVGRASLGRHVPAEFAERQARTLHCAECHGKVDGFPPLEILGGKLKPEWVARFIGGEIPYKPRAEKHPRGEPWLEARMPAFRSRAALLASGLAAQHGFPAQTPREPPVRMDLAAFGQKLAGKDGGFSCISCHAVGAQEALEVFESEGINLAYGADRLLPAYYRRWMRNPLSIDPQTKMPVYFEEGKSPLTEILDGDGEKQIEALWEYLRLGDKMPAPAP